MKAAWYEKQGPARARLHYRSALTPLPRSRRPPAQLSQPTDSVQRPPTASFRDAGSSGVGNRRRFRFAAPTRI